MAKTKEKNKKSPWSAIKVEYITGEASLRTLAKKYEISESKIFRRSKKEGWAEEREAYRSEVTAEALASARTRAIKDQTDILTAAKTLAGEIILALDDPAQFYRYIVSDGKGNSVMREFSKLDAKAVKDIASALEKLSPLIKAIEEPEGQTEIKVTMGGDAERYSV